MRRFALVPAALLLLVNSPFVHAEDDHWVATGTGTGAVHARHAAGAITGQSGEYTAQAGSGPAIRARHATAATTAEQASSEAQDLNAE
jgi:hypothetical protein